MIYITIIIVAIVAALCILGYRYMSLIHNPDLYQSIDTECIIDIVQPLLDKYEIYDNAKGEDRYKYAISDLEIKTALHYILKILHADDNN